MKLTRAQLRKKAYKLAKCLIADMDLTKFWGEEITDTNRYEDLQVFQMGVVLYLEEKFERLKGPKE